MVRGLFIHFLYQSVKQDYGWKEITKMTESPWYKDFFFLLQQPLRETIREVKIQRFCSKKSAKFNLQKILVQLYSTASSRGKQKQDKRQIPVQNVTKTRKYLVKFMFPGCNPNVFGSHFHCKCALDQSTFSFSLCHTFLKDAHSFTGEERETVQIAKRENHLLLP